MPHLAHIALLVRDYEPSKLGFTLVEDTHQPEQDRVVPLCAPIV
jgi:hypothetical protein